MQPLAVPGFFTWSRWQSDRRLFFSSFFLVREGGNVAFDPLPLDAADAREIEALGGVAAILLTNRDHERDAAAMRERFGARVLASRREEALFALPVDGTFDREALPGILSIELRGAKTPGEVAFLIERDGVAVIGDAVIGSPAGALAFLPDEKLADPIALALSLRPLWSPEVRTLLLGDGASLFSGAYEAMGALLEARGGPAVNRINLDELEYADRPGPGIYQSGDAEVGLRIGALQLGYRVARIARGKSFCPMHAHDRGEELFYVIEGSPSIRTPRGTLQLRAGDFMAFPTGDRGAHQLFNDGAGDALVLMLGTDDPDEVIAYPDSRKILVRRRGLRMREDRLDYFDGE